MPGTAGRALHDPFYQRQHESLLTPLVTLEDLGREAVPRVYGTLSVTGPMRVSSRHFPGLPHQPIGYHSQPQAAALAREAATARRRAGSSSAGVQFAVVPGLVAVLSGGVNYRTKLSFS